MNLKTTTRPAKNMAALTLLLLAAVLYACGGKSQQEPKQTVTPAGQFPIVEEKMTMSAFSASWGNAPGAQDNAFVRYVEEQTNIRLEVDVALRGADADQKKSLLLASGDYPEIFINGLFTKAEQKIYGDMGVFLPLNDLIAEYGVNTRKVFGEYPLVEANTKLADGSIYSLPSVSDCFHCSYYQKMWIYQPWLDQLGLEMPTTTEEFKEVLLAFRDRDPNGNGLADEIPLSGNIQNRNSGVDGFIMNAFVYTPGNLGENALNRMYLEGGKITASFAQPGWKDGLAYMNDLYNERLIDPDAFIQDNNQHLSLGENPDAVLLGATAGPHPGIFTYVNGESGRWLEYKVVPPLKGPGGLRITRHSPLYGDVAWTITDKAQNPEAAFRLGDAFYSEDFTLRNIYGREGLEWERAEPGELGINGLPAIFKTIAAESEGRATSHFDQSGPFLLSRTFRLGQVNEGPESLAVILYEETKNKMEPYGPDISMIIPPLTYSEEAATEVLELESALQAYVVEMIGRFTTGDADIETGWDDYLAELQNIGLARYVELMQQAYDAR